MLSYLHGFHAGNFADVHKHLLLNLLFESLNRKHKPWSYLETHSGRAHYDFSDERALKTAEFRDGIGRLWNAGTLPAGLQAYVEQVRALNPDGTLRFYPGSPTLAAQAAREADQIRLMELHPNEVDVLRQVFKRDERVAVHHRDGYEGVGALLPPTPRRGLVLIDPAYEVKEEYAQLVRFVVKALKRWPTGIYAIWYPLLAADRWQTMLAQLKNQVQAPILRSELRLAEPAERGMYGSGMLVINPPWQLDSAIAEATAPLPGLLGAQTTPALQLDWLVAEDG